jgi:hypothetical protein
MGDDWGQRRIEIIRYLLADLLPPAEIFVGGIFFMIVPDFPRNDQLHIHVLLS